MNCRTVAIDYLSIKESPAKNLSIKHSQVSKTDINLKCLEPLFSSCNGVLPHPLLYNAYSRQIEMISNQSSLKTAKDEEEGKN